MAIGKHTGIARKEMSYCDVFTGSAEALIAAGLVDQHQLPGEPGRGKMMASYLPDGAPAKKGDGKSRFMPGYTKIERNGKTFKVYVTVDEAEHSRRLERFRDEHHKRAEFERAQAKAQKHADELPKSHEAYREQQARYLGWLEGAAEAVLSTSGGYSFDADTADNVRVLVGAIRQAIAEGRTQFRQADLDAQIAEIRAKARSADPDFARFLGRLGGGS